MGFACYSQLSVIYQFSLLPQGCAEVLSPQYQREGFAQEVLKISSQFSDVKAALLRDLIKPECTTQEQPLHLLKDSTFPLPIHINASSLYY